MQHNLTFIDWLKNRLLKPLPGFDVQRRMMPIGRELPTQLPINKRVSAVLLLLYPELEDFKLVMIERALDDSAHSGQIAFPGGKVEHFDVSLEDTALREANEEIDLKRSLVRVLGRLTPMFIPISNFQVVPIVGFCENRPLLKASPDEVANILEFSFQDDFDKKVVDALFYSKRADNEITAPAYLFKNDQMIWGASAMILSELEWLWEEYKATIK